MNDNKSDSKNHDQYEHCSSTKFFIFLSCADPLKRESQYDSLLKNRLFK